MDKQKESYRKDLLEERERLKEQRARLMDTPLNVFERAAMGSRPFPVRPGNAEDKTRVMDLKTKSDKTAAAAWDARMNQVDSRLQDVNEALRRAAPSSYEFGQRVEKALTGKRSDEYKKGGKVKAYANGGSVRGGGCESRTKKTKYV